MKNLLIILFALLLTSCVIKTHYIQDDAQSYDKSNVSDIKVYSNLDIGQEYDVIGSVAVDANGDAQDAMEALKEEAALMGATAVVDVHLTKITSFGQRTGLSGVAVRLK
jgi:hypothetical protein